MNVKGESIGVRGGTRLFVSAGRKLRYRWEWPQRGRRVGPKICCAHIASNFPTASGSFVASSSAYMLTTLLFNHDLELGSAPWLFTVSKLSMHDSFLFMHSFSPL